jgi:hypothetical protein
VAVSAKTRTGQSCLRRLQSVGSRMMDKLLIVVVDLVMSSGGTGRIGVVYCLPTGVSVNMG